MKKLLIAFSLAVATAHSQSLLESFGSGSNQFQIEFVTIGNPGNTADTAQASLGFPPMPTSVSIGSVAYSFHLAKFEISRDMVEKANQAGSLGITLQDMTNIGGNGANRPASGTSWFEAARFVNWLNTSTGNAAAYKFDGSGNFQLWSSSDAGYNANNQFRNSLAKYVLPTMDEWYKGAFGSPGGTWYDYATGSDTLPTAVTSGTTSGTAVYGQTGPGSSPADIDKAGGLSPFDTMGQNGNVGEWTESAVDGVNDLTTESRALLGGSYGQSSFSMPASNLGQGGPTLENPSTGFRVAIVVPEPSSASLLLGGLAGLAAMRRRRAV